MDFLSLFWNIDVSNTTKIIAFIIFVIFILCIICKPRNKKIDTYVADRGPSKCQIDYKTCQENSKRGNKNVCYVCKPNGDYPEKIHHPQLGWIKLNPKTGKQIN